MELQGCTLHHVGYTVADIKATAAQFARFGYKSGDILLDEALQVEICYLTLDGHETVELIHQLNASSLEAQLLKDNGVMPYHLAFVADDFDRTCADLDALGYIRLFDPVPVSALGGIRIIYYRHPDLGYLEILEKSESEKP
ncbi:MAG: VOC family protein [Bacteroidales bacterium]|nr:VOC family protein [Bacteroidales bacterium]